ncbi:MAG: iron-sulfur cluster-binding protein [Hyphomicrobium sp.]|nr:iron-sulfur cluster-binding protein [Hyphomicrobium sp.]PPD09424.1 MAG: iron-sulfur cluster-binding protein [Hyphomicrobium sp.]
MKPDTAQFRENAAAAIADPRLQSALAKLPGGLVAQRRAAVTALPEFEALRDEARAIRDATLANLATHLEAFEAKATAMGSHVHWATDADEARQTISNICNTANARLVIKGKSMVTEEIGLNAYLQNSGIEVVESDLGEYIIQKRGEAPSHIIAPAIHLTEADVEADFRSYHTHLDRDRELGTPERLVAEARAVLREKFLNADVGITGANFLISETGSSIIVTNEGNGDLTQILPRIHIVVATIDKVVPTLDEAMTLLRVLARSATGQDMTAYTTLATGPRRADDLDGPTKCHIVLIDNGRTEMLASDMREALRCIRCGACMNHCPVYNAIGGHAYGWVYPGPIGAVLTPALLGITETRHLPNASTFCGACESVCPVKIPLVSLMRTWRERAHNQGPRTRGARILAKLWSAAATRPALYHLLARFAVAIAGALGRAKGRFRRLPIARGWLKHRDLPAPQGRTFQQLWKEAERGVPR